MPPPLTMLVVLVGLGFVIGLELKKVNETKKSLKCSYAPFTYFMIFIE